MFTKLDMIDNQLVFTNYFECRHDDVTADQFWLEFSIFRAREWGIPWGLVQVRNHQI